MSLLFWLLVPCLFAKLTVGKVLPELLKKFPQEEAQSYHIDVGTEPDGHNVIDDDLPLPSFRAAGIEDTPHYHINEDRVTFHVSRKATEDDDKIVLQEPTLIIDSKDVQAAQPEGNSVGAPAVTLMEAEVVGWGKLPLKPVPRINDKGALAFTLQFTCHDAGLFTVEVTLRLFKMTGTKTRRDLAFTIEKNCEAASDAVVGSALVGFHVGTTVDGDIVTPNVIKDGEATEAYLVRHDDNEDRLTVIPAKKDFEKFWFQYIPEQADGTGFSEAIVQVEDPNALLVETLGTFSVNTKGKHLLQHPTDLILKFFCMSKDSDSTLVTVSVKSPDKPDVLMTFSFVKECAGPRHAEGILLPGFNIELESATGEAGTAALVVKDGVTTHAFRSATTSNGNGDEAANDNVVEAKISSLEFTLSLAQDAESVRFKRPILITTHLPTDGEKKLAEPAISGDVRQANSINPGTRLKMKITFNCLRSGEAIVEVEIPVYPKGAIQFSVKKQCHKSGNVTEAIPTQTEISGLFIGTRRGASDVAKNGIIEPKFNWIDDASTLKEYRHDSIYSSIFISLKDESHFLKLAAPELISTLDIFLPTISGHGSEGAVVDVENPTSFTVTFHCLSQGEALVTLLLRIIDTQEEIAGKTAIVSEDPIKITFKKQCAASSVKAVSKLGGVYLPGLNIGLSPEGSEIVKNGVPEPPYFGQRGSKSVKPKDVIARDVASLRLYIHFDSVALESEDFVELGAPRCVEQHSTAKPQLSGSAADGGTLVRDGDEEADSETTKSRTLELDIAFNCMFAGRAAIAIVIPIKPHGEITFTIPKECDGDVHPVGRPVPGLNVHVIGGEEAGKAPLAVISDGLVQDPFSTYISKKPWKTSDVNTTFSIQLLEGAASEKIFALEPIALCHRHYCRPYVSHTLRRPTKGEVPTFAPDKATSSSSASSSDDDVEVVIDRQLSTVTVVYDCQFQGSTFVTLTMRLIPDFIVVAWTWRVTCPKIDLTQNDFLETLEFDYDFDEFETEITSPLTRPDGSDQGLSDAAGAGGGGAAGARGDGGGDAGGGGGNANRRGGGGWDRGVDSDGLDIADAYLEDGSWPDMFEFDEEGFEDFYAEPAIPVSLCILNDCDDVRVNIGTSLLHKSDVVSVGVTNPVFTASCFDKKDCFVVSYAKDSTTFYISLDGNSERQYFGTPKIEVERRRNDSIICQPKISGTAKGADYIQPDDVLDLKIDYNCMSPGVARILVHIPRSSNSMREIMFTYVKICGGFKQQQPEFSWTARRGLMTIFVLLFGVGAVIGCYMFRKQEEISATSPVSPVKKKLIAENGDIEMESTMDRDRDDESD